MAYYKTQKRTSGSGGYVPCQWADGTDAEIVEALEKHYAGECNLYDYWTVGDERTVHLSAMSAMSPLTDTHSAQDVVLVLSNVGGKILSDGVTECVFQVDQKNSLSEAGPMNISNNNYYTRWNRRDWCNSVYKDAIPSTLRPIFKEFLNKTHGGGAGSYENIITTTDTFFLRAEVEVFGETTKSAPGEGNQVAWYATSGNRKKWRINGWNSWWERSPQFKDGTYFCDVTASGTTTTYQAKYDAGIAPFGVI